MPPQLCFNAGTLQQGSRLQMRVGASSSTDWVFIDGIICLHHIDASLSQPSVQAVKTDFHK